MHINFKPNISLYKYFFNENAENNNNSAHVQPKSDDNTKIIKYFATEKRGLYIGLPYVL